MPTYRITYRDGSQHEIVLDQTNPLPNYVLALAADESGRPTEHAANIVRLHAGERHVFWQRPRGTGVPRAGGGPVGEPTPERPIRLFVSFAYEIEQMYSIGPMRRAVFGNTLLDIEFEPNEGAHIEGLQRQIEEYVTGQVDEKPESLILLGWQRVQRKAERVEKIERTEKGER